MEGYRPSIRNVQDMLRMMEFLADSENMKKAAVEYETLSAKIEEAKQTLGSFAEVENVKTLKDSVAEEKEKAKELAASVVADARKEASRIGREARAKAATKEGEAMRKASEAENLRAKVEAKLEEVKLKDIELTGIMDKLKKDRAALDSEKAAHKADVSNFMKMLGQFGN